MSEVLARFQELDARRMTLPIAEQNERRDCEIALGMVPCRPETRANAARRCERWAKDRR